MEFTTTQTIVVFTEMKFTTTIKTFLCTTAQKYHYARAQERGPRRFGAERNLAVGSVQNLYVGKCMKREQKERSKKQYNTTVG